MPTKTRPSALGQRVIDPTLVRIERLDLRHLQVTLIGDTQLVTHRWAEKAKREMRQKQGKLGSQPREAKNPQDDFESALYWHPDGGYGFPSVGVKACAIRGAKMLGLTMTDMRAAFHIDGELVRVESIDADGHLTDPALEGTSVDPDGADGPVMREDMVRVGMGTADLRYRPSFKNWRMPVNIIYNARAVSAEQLVAMLDAGGFGVGLGEWRSEKDGQWGRFHVAMAGLPA